MGTTFIQSGCVMEFVAPSGGVTVNIPVYIGGFFVIPQITAAATVAFTGYMDGVHTLPKTISEGDLLQGQPLFWDVANAKVSVDSSLGLSIGSLTAAALTAATSCPVRLNGTSLAGRVLTIRKRIAVATVTAGTTLLPAITGGKYRMIAASAISVGGAAGAVTTVDIIGTVSTARKLVAFAQASLTQSTVLKDGGTGAAVLADGASYTANDVSTAITVGITGSAITVATSIDFSLTYQIE